MRNSIIPNGRGFLIFSDPKNTPGNRLGQDLPFSLNRHMIDLQRRPVEQGGDDRSDRYDRGPNGYDEQPRSIEGSAKKLGQHQGSELGIGV
jgi:hypothetical protein